MYKVKTFTCSLKVFHTKEELDELDRMVNQFVEENNVQRVVSASDTCTTDDTGASIGVIRVLAYE